LYRGIIVNDLRQYVLLGDARSHTDGVISDDDRWLFTEENPARELQTAAHLAGISRALRGHNDTLAQWAFDAAVALYNKTAVPPDAAIPKIHAAVELYLATNEPAYANYILQQTEQIVANIEQTGWFVARAEKRIKNADFTAKIQNALRRQQANLRMQSEETPYGIPYRPKIWGAGWDIQEAGFKYYFLYDAYPDLFPPDFVYNAVNFVLGCHPGFNTASFAGGVGARSAIPMYGNNRADGSYIPGGVISGTALIRPDYPELQENWGFNWQQHEVCIGHTSDFVFLVLAAQKIARGAGKQ
jgi:hypothetical protein